MYIGSLSFIPHPPRTDACYLCRKRTSSFVTIHIEIVATRRHKNKPSTDTVKYFVSYTLPSTLFSKDTEHWCRVGTGGNMPARTPGIHPDSEINNSVLRLGLCSRQDPLLHQNTIRLFFLALRDPAVHPWRANHRRQCRIAR